MSRPEDLPYFIAATASGMRKQLREADIPADGLKYELARQRPAWRRSCSTCATPASILCWGPRFKRARQTYVVHLLILMGQDVNQRVDNLQPLEQAIVLANAPNPFLLSTDRL
ncbi:hypothetical protein DHEL01_v205230 [Diaporthe helianthi]|uniref:Uncharacterized protein n=1 Tax=Diaporthe helianthi TaxID=158607 RepID=A0A2P5I1M7_DIAHE|nr:hypothetical protein DHEL01_v205230 [Diaporthe helianthi]